MAQYRLEVQTIQRSAGRSAVAAAAYRSGDRLIDERLAMEFDFGAKGDIEFAAIMAPADAPAAFGDRQTLWNAAEDAEKRKDAVPARELLVSLPHELDFAQRRALVEAFVSEQLVARGMVADVAMHRPGKEGDERNFHAHILVTTRSVGPAGFGKKPAEWWSPKAVREWRSAWAEIQNEHLRRHLGPAEAAGQGHPGCAGRAFQRGAFRSSRRAVPTRPGEARRVSEDERRPRRRE